MCTARLGKNMCPEINGALLLRSPVAQPPGLWIYNNMIAGAPYVHIMCYYCLHAAAAAVHGFKLIALFLLKTLRGRCDVCTADRLGGRIKMFRFQSFVTVAAQSNSIGICRIYTCYEGNARGANRIAGPTTPSPGPEKQPDDKRLLRGNV